MGSTATGALGCTLIVDPEGVVALGVCTGTYDGALVGWVGTATGVGAEGCGVATVDAVDFGGAVGGVDWLGSINRIATAG